MRMCICDNKADTAHSWSMTMYVCISWELIPLSERRANVLGNYVMWLSSEVAFWLAVDVIFQLCSQRKWKSTKCKPCQKLQTQFLSTPTCLDDSPIRGEYKVWIYKRYLVPSLHYKFTVNKIFNGAIKIMNAKATKFIKSWLGLTRSTSVAVLHHAVILDIPFLSDYNTKAKLSYLSSVCRSPDPFIEELSSPVHSWQRMVFLLSQNPST